MKVEIISIGTELLLNQILNTNAAHAARCLREVQLDLAYQVTVGDVVEHVVEAIRAGMARSDIVIAIGRLGNKENDFARQAAAIATRRSMVGGEDSIVGAKVLGGTQLTTHALLLEEPGSTLICLPGRPREMAYLLETEVLPYLQGRQADSRQANWVLLRTAGLMESTLNQLLSDLPLNDRQRITFSSYAGQTDIRLWAEAESEFELQQSLGELTEQVKMQLGDHVFGTEGDRLERVLLRQLQESQLTLMVAECHTNGRLSRMLQSLVGADQVVSTLPVQSDIELADFLELTHFEKDSALTGWCRSVTERLRETSGRDLALLVYQHVRPGGVQLLVTLASAYGVSVTQRSFGGHPGTMEDWAGTLGMIHLRRWLLAHGGPAGSLADPATTTTDY